MQLHGGELFNLIAPRMLSFVGRSTLSGHETSDKMLHARAEAIRPIHAKSGLLTERIRRRESMQVNTPQALVRSFQCHSSASGFGSKTQSIGAGTDSNLRNDPAQ